MVFFPRFPFNEAYFLAKWIPVGPGFLALLMILLHRCRKQGQGRPPSPSDFPSSFEGKLPPWRPFPEAPFRSIKSSKRPLSEGRRRILSSTSRKKALMSLACTEFSYSGFFFRHTYFFPSKGNRQSMFFSLRFILFRLGLFKVGTPLPSL